MNKDIWGKKDVAAHSQCTPNTFERIKGVYFVRISYSIWPDCAEKQIIAMFFFFIFVGIGASKWLCQHIHATHTSARTTKPRPWMPLFSPVRPSHASSNCVDFFFLFLSYLFTLFTIIYFYLVGESYVMVCVCVCRSIWFIRHSWRRVLAALWCVCGNFSLFARANSHSPTGGSVQGVAHWIVFKRKTFSQRN